MAIKTTTIDTNQSPLSPPRSCLPRCLLESGLYLWRNNQIEEEAMQEIIEKLKDKTKVKAFGLMEPEEREVYKKAGNRNCLYYLVKDSWPSTLSGNFLDANTYIIKPDYQPEPEFVDLEIVMTGGCWLGVWQEDDSPLPHQNFTQLHCLPSLPNFHCFWSGEIYTAGRLFWQTGTVASIKANGKKVWARFRAGEHG